MVMPVLSFNDGPQSVDEIPQLNSDEFRDWVWVCVASQLALLIFQDLNEAMRSASVDRSTLGMHMNLMRVAAD
jgi:hypothetical protein